MSNTGRPGGEPGLRIFFFLAGTITTHTEEEEEDVWWLWLFVRTKWGKRDPKPPDCPPRMCERFLLLLHSYLIARMTRVNINVYIIRIRQQTWPYSNPEWERERERGERVSASLPPIQQNHYNLNVAPSGMSQRFYGPNLLALSSRALAYTQFRYYSLNRSARVWIFFSSAQCTWWDRFFQILPSVCESKVDIFKWMVEEEEVIIAERSQLKNAQNWVKSKKFIFVKNAHLLLDADEVGRGAVAVLPPWTLQRWVAALPPYVLPWVANQPPGLSSLATPLWMAGRWAPHKHLHLIYKPALCF